MPKVKVARTLVEYYDKNDPAFEVCPLNEQGKKHGTCVTFYADGRILSAVTYENGILNGPCTRYRDDGAIMANGVFENGKYIPDEQTEAKTARWNLINQLHFLPEYPAAKRREKATSLIKLFRDKYPEKGAGRMPKRRSGKEL